MCLWCLIPAQQAGEHWQFNFFGYGTGSVWCCNSSEPVMPLPWQWLKSVPGQVPRWEQGRGSPAAGTQGPGWLCSDVLRCGAETNPVHPRAFGDDGAFPVLEETARQEGTCGNIVLSLSPIFGGSHKPAFNLSRFRGVPPVYQASAPVPGPRACQVPGAAGRAVIAGSSQPRCFRWQWRVPRSPI